VSAAYEAKQATISAYNISVLESVKDIETFFDALDNPPKPTRRLSEAFALC